MNILDEIPEEEERSLTEIGVIVDTYFQKAQAGDWEGMMDYLDSMMIDRPCSDSICAHLRTSFPMRSKLHNWTARAIDGRDFLIRTVGEASAGSTLHGLPIPMKIKVVLK